MVNPLAQAVMHVDAWGTNWWAAAWLPPGFIALGTGDFYMAAWTDASRLNDIDVMMVACAQTTGRWLEG